MYFVCTVYIISLVMSIESNNWQPKMQKYNFLIVINVYRRKWEGISPAKFEL